ncbi:hypothetical protein EPO15_10770 [bacterium]|nr:MAG: hypothetical protein EPO15_10770 [bacterium]
MALLTTVSTSVSLRGRLRLAHALRMPERDAEAEVREIEASRAFQLLREARVVSLQPYTRMRFAARRFQGWELRSAGQGLPEVLDGRGDLVGLMESMGQERFEEYFLRAEGLSDEERAHACGISPIEAGQLRDLVNRLYVQSEFEAGAGYEAPEKVMSAVAGIEIESGRPVLAFFHQDVWKGRYEVDSGKRAEVLARLSPSEAREAEGLLFMLDLLERRKSTLYRALEALIVAQADYFVTRDPGRRVPLTQRTLAARLGVAPNAFNMVIGNKAVQLPWGPEVPIKVLMPSTKTILLDRLYELVTERPNLSDQGLGLELGRRFGARLSRRSVAQYRSDLGIGGYRQRVVAA